MSNPFRIKQIRRTALQALSFATGYALEEGILRTHVGDITRPPLTDEEWADTVAWLLDNNLMVPIDCLPDDTLQQWAITEHGRTVLATI